MNSRATSHSTSRIHRLVCLVACLLVSGCASIDASVPSAAALKSPPPNAPSIILSAVKDARNTEAAGGVGAASIQLKSGFDEYIGNSFANGLSSSGYAVSSAAAKSQKPGAKTVVVTVESAHIASFDAIMEPAKAQVSIAVQVFGESQSPVYAHSYTGDYSETLGIHTQSGYEEHAGKVFAIAADQAVNKAIADPSFQRAIKQ